MAAEPKFEIRVGGAAESAKQLRQLVGESYSQMYDLVESPLDALELIGRQLDKVGEEAPASLWQRFQESQRDVLSVIRETPDETEESFGDQVRREAQANVVQLIPKPGTRTKRKKDKIVPFLVRGAAPPGPTKPIPLPWLARKESA